MEGYEGYCPKLLDLMTPKQEMINKKKNNTVERKAEEHKLELSLGIGPPGQGNHHHRHHSHHDLLNLYGAPCAHAILKSPFFHHHHLRVEPSSGPPHVAAAVVKESSEKMKNKVFSPAAPAAPTTTTITGNSSAHKRTATAPVVGWPPVRSFRKNLASGSTSKSASESPSSGPNNVSGQLPVENSLTTLFVKINMDGIPIGRKVNLKAYDSYEKLADAVDELFRGLLAAQMDCGGGGGRIDVDGEGGIKIGELLDGSGEYTLVYEDNEGDRMLVGDVPWHMFVSTAKRLRVLKSSELPSLSRGSKQGKFSLDA